MNIHFVELEIGIFLVLTSCFVWKCVYLYPDLSDSHVKHFVIWHFCFFVQILNFIVSLQILILNSLLLSRKGK